MLKPQYETATNNRYGGGSGRRFGYESLDAEIAAKKKEIKHLKIKNVLDTGMPYTAEIGQLERSVHELETAQGMETINQKYEAYYKRPDFLTRSVYKPKSVTMKFAPNVNTFDEWHDIIYNGIHDISSTYSDGKETWATSQIRYLGYDQLTEKERQLYAYLYDESPQMAHEMLNLLRPTLLYRRGKIQAEQHSAYAQANPFGASLKSIGTNAMSGIMYPAQLAAAHMDENLHPFDPVFDYNYQTGVYRQEGRQALGKTLGNEPIGGLVFDGMMLGGDLLAAKGVGKLFGQITGNAQAGQTAAATMMAAQGGSQSLHENIQRGLGGSQSANLSMLNTGIELYTNHFTFEELLAHPGQTVKRLAAIADRVGAAEAAGEIAKLAGDILIAGDRSAAMAEYRELCKTMPPRQATLEMFRRYGQRMLYSRAVGTLGGGVAGATERFHRRVERKQDQPRGYWEEPVDDTVPSTEQRFTTYDEPAALPQSTSRALPEADLRATIEGGQTAAAGYKPKLGAEGYTRQTYTGQAWTMDYQTTSGVKLTATPGKTTTILGRYDQDTKAILEELQIPKGTDFEMNMQGFNLLNTPDDLYRSADQFWLQYNKPFLDAAIARGDVFLMATPPERRYCYKKHTNQETGFGREYRYLCEHGYHYDNGRMVKGE